MSHKVKVKLRFNSFQEFAGLKDLLTRLNVSLESFVSVAVQKEIESLLQRIKVEQASAKSESPIAQGNPPAEGASGDTNREAFPHQENSLDTSAAGPEGLSQPG